MKKMGSPTLTWHTIAREKEKDLSQIYNEKDLHPHEYVKVYKSYLQYTDMPDDWPAWMLAKLKCGYTGRVFTEYKKFKAHVLKNRPK